VLSAPGRPALAVTATPCRHGAAALRPLVGDVIGFALRWEGQTHGALWVSGDSVLYDGLREVAGRDRARVRARHGGAAPPGLLAADR
jgi:hypothetical protein